MDISIKDTATALTALSGVIAGIIGIFKYFQYKTRRDKIAAVGEAFNSVVHALASDIEVERLAGGIRLRRFFDPEMSRKWRAGTRRAACSEGTNSSGRDSELHSPALVIKCCQKRDMHRRLSTFILLLTCVVADPGPRQPSASLGQ